jgi:inorganic pyrophosphatase/exopolyphosphatase
VLVELPDAGVCLVDHQQTSQLNPAIDVDRIVGVIDHHALQNATIVTDKPIYIDIRPWGSMSTIIAHTFLTMRRRPTRQVAGMLLCAILSDTLNLQGPTTTEWDRAIVATLVEIAGVTDIQYLAAQQFKAKSSELAGLTPEALCNGDQKVFSFKSTGFTGTVGFAVVETTDDDVILSRSKELLEALREDKEAKRLSLLYLAVVNIVLLRTTLLLCGPAEQSLALASFPDAHLIHHKSLEAEEDGATFDMDHHEINTISSSTDELLLHDGGVAVIDHSWKQAGELMDLGNLVSRKKNLIPAITQAIKKGWAAPVPVVTSTSPSPLPNKSFLDNDAKNSKKEEMMSE